MTCPVESAPAGWKVWRGAVPPALAQIAIDVRDHINQYEYGSFAKIVDYNGNQVGVFKSHHTWTNRNGALVTGICIPGVSLLIPSTQTTGAGVSGVPRGLGDATTDATTDLATPDASKALFGADDLVATDWRLVGATVLATGLVILAFREALRHAGRARR